MLDEADEQLNDTLKNHISLFNQKWGEQYLPFNLLNSQHDSAIHCLPVYGNHNARNS